MNYTKQIFDSLIFWRAHSLFSCRKDKKISRSGNFQLLPGIKVKKVIRGVLVTRHVRENSPQICLT